MEIDIKDSLFTIPLNVSYKNIENTIVIALEVGSNYWMGFNVEDNPWIKEWLDGEHPQEKSFTETIAHSLVYSKETVIFYDPENEETKWELTLKKMLRGIELYFNNPRKHNLVINSFDAHDMYDADVIMQLSIFEEIKYG
jgi:hypothetical protein